MLNISADPWVFVRALVGPATASFLQALEEPLLRWYELYPPRRIRYHDDELSDKFMPGVQPVICVVRGIPVLRARVCVCACTCVCVCV